MSERRFVAAGAIGSALAAGVFFVVLERRLVAEEWGRVIVTAVVFGVFMALWNGPLIHLDSKQRTARNVLFEHILVEFVAVLAVAWTLVAVLGHLRWQDLVWYSLGGAPFPFLTYLLTRKHIKDEGRRELFA